MRGKLTEIASARNRFSHSMTVHVSADFDVCLHGEINLIDIIGLLRCLQLPIDLYRKSSLCRRTGGVRRWKAGNCRHWTLA